MFPKHKRWQSQPKKKWPKKVNKSRRKMSNSITIYRNIRKYWDGNVVYPNIPKTTSLSLSLWDSGWSESFSASRRTCAFKVLACVFFTHFLSSNLCFQLICRILPVLSNLFTHFLSSIPPLPSPPINRIRQPQPIQYKVWNVQIPPHDGWAPPQCSTTLTCSPWTRKNCHYYYLSTVPKCEYLYLEVFFPLKTYFLLKGSQCLKST